MKRLFEAISSFTEESEAIIKRARLLISSFTTSIQINQNTTNSQNEHDEPETTSDTEDEHELIDLTDDEPTSSKLESKSSDIDKCPICLETLSDLQSLDIHLIITPCQHVMCTLCSQQLLSTSSRCPLCRENINLDSLIPYYILS